MKLTRLIHAAAPLGLAVAALVATVSTTSAQSGDDEGARLYRAACQSCHGEDGAGVSRDRIAFDVPLPDFTDCSFASREPDFDWVAVAHQGGPVRGFDATMPAFGEALTEEQLLRIVQYTRVFCDDDRWPRGELNLARPLLTEKAYPEDEGVTTLSVNTEGGTAVVNELLYEKRLGALTQIEVELPFGVVDAGGPTSSTHAGIGDVALGVKRTLWHTLEGGAIVSVGGEVVLPTGDDAQGLGGGATVLEPYVALGKILGEAGFVHVQALTEHPVSGGGDVEAELRAALGFSTTSGAWGRTWSPMLEVVGGRDLVSGATTHWDVVPQMQVTLNTRQHVMANVGLLLPLTNSGARPTRLMVYLLWDWFDGGFFDGW